ncbi:MULTISPECIES: hypothetical protein [Nosocomiicoccus]|nr:MULTISPECIES: hypothetical protein [Nosocomiicoccus]OFO53619.1 hypothetical protein HMPREF3029_05525 [Nosocomiicoccus sp. HMSC059G07]OFS62022.1 hypothetical protein HMPREF3177_06925 [Nosocomiicoccus sp. HMSC09A07]
MFEWIKLGVTVVFIILMLVVFFKNKNVTRSLIILLIAHSIIIFSLRFFVGNEPLVDSILGAVYLIVIAVFSVLIFRALKQQDN